MISSSDDVLIVHLPFEQQSIRFNSVETTVLNLGAGMAEVEAEDGTRWFIANPLEHWARDMIDNNGTVSASATNPVFSSGYAGQRVYFVLDPIGPRPNPGQDDSRRSLIDATDIL